MMVGYDLGYEADNNNNNNNNNDNNNIDKTVKR